MHLPQLKEMPLFQPDSRRVEVTPATQSAPSAPDPDERKKPALELFLVQ